MNYELFSMVFISITCISIIFRNVRIPNPFMNRRRITRLNERMDGIDMNIHSIKQDLINLNKTINKKLKTK